MSESVLFNALSYLKYQNWLKIFATENKKKANFLTDWLHGLITYDLMTEANQGFLLFSCHLDNSNGVIDLFLVLVRETVKLIGKLSIGRNQRHLFVIVSMVLATVHVAKRYTVCGFRL